MVDLTTLTTPFGLLEPEVQKALRMHGGPYEFFSSGGTWCSALPNWDPALVYRVKVEPIELWVNVYREENGAPHGYAYETREKADRYRGDNCIRLVRMREVDDA